MMGGAVAPGMMMPNNGMVPQQQPNFGMVNSNGMMQQPNNMMGNPGCFAETESPEDVAY